MKDRDAFVMGPPTKLLRIEQIWKPTLTVLGWILLGLTLGLHLDLQLEQ